MTTAHTLAWLAVALGCGMAGFLAGLIVNAPEGYEDADGFHFGRENEQ